MDAQSATLLAPKRPIRRIDLHELYRRSYSYVHHLPSTLAEFEFFNIGENNTVSGLRGISGARIPGLGHYQGASIESDEEGSEFRDDETTEIDEDDETTIRAVSVSDGGANDANRGKRKARISTKAGKRPVRVGGNRTERIALAWLKRVLNIIHMLSLYTMICDGADGVLTQLQEDRLSATFRRGVVHLYNQLKSRALDHTTVLTRLFGPIISASNVVHAPFRAHSKRFLESEPCRNFPFKNFTEYMRSEVKKRLPDPDYKPLFPLPRDQISSLLASANNPPPDRPIPSNDSPPAQSKTSDDPKTCPWYFLPHIDLEHTNDTLHGGILLAGMIFDGKDAKALLPHRRFRLIRNSRILENVRPDRKQSVGWVSFRIGRNMMGHSTHYHALASHPFQSNQLLQALWEETESVCLATKSGEAEEVQRYAGLFTVRTMASIILDRKLMKTTGECTDAVIVKMGGCRRFVNAAAWVGLPQQYNTL